MWVCRRNESGKDMREYTPCPRHKGKDFLDSAGRQSDVQLVARIEGEMKRGRNKERKPVKIVVKTRKSLWELAPSFREEAATSTYICFLRSVEAETENEFRGGDQSIVWARRILKEGGWYSADSN
jgi:hypothetical protein